MKKLLFIGLLALLISNLFAQKPELSNMNASPETKSFYEKLAILAKDYIMFGHQDDLAYGIGWWAEEGRSDVKEVSGSYPAVFGWDIAHIGEERNIDSVSFEKMKTWIVRVYEMGGINTISWHIRNPVNQSDAWDTEEAVSKVLPGGSHHEYFKKQLDKAAVFFNELKTSENVAIPVIFRPYHECTGSWFWWGGKNVKPEEYTQLWKFTKNYLEKEKGVNNLIWCYSTDRFNSEEHYLELYPGDGFVDILGFDDYHSPQDNPGHFASEIKILTEMAKEKNKIATFSETGMETIPLENYWTNTLLKPLKAYGKGISYVLVWRNGRPDHFYAPYPGQKSADDFKKFKNDESILFLDELNNILK
ncbi:MAG: beta-mannosidase [Prolixibacteraceae bacterium]|nr:beta-mannosidase [Prolixibacteraceae bacterium]